ncbi:MAG TPA: osmotically inducible lipoprotein OsmB [Burkholderiales bacterium]|nr:osmotically inducible lipoprotein OsmB [Burkholderiales bacterium]
MDTTKLRIPAGVAVAIVCLLLAVIAVNPSRAQIGTVAGALAGGLALSAVTGGSVLGTLAGVAGGAVVGYEIGKRMPP